MVSSYPKTTARRYYRKYKARGCSKDIDKLRKALKQKKMPSINTFYKRLRIWKIEDLWSLLEQLKSTDISYNIENKSIRFKKQ